MTTTYFLNVIAGNVFQTKTSPALPTEYYIGVSTTAPNMDGTGVTEPKDSAYARVKVASLTAPENGVVKNAADIPFADATQDWGTCTHFVMYDAKTGGNLLMAGKLDRNRIVQADSQLRFLANGLTLTLKNVSE